MANRINVSICDQEYTLVAEEEAAYMQKVSASVDGKMRQIIDTTHTSRCDAAVLTAVNLADELYKAQESLENLRRQVKTYLDEANAARNEVSELKRQYFKAQNNPNGRH